MGVLGGHPVFVVYSPPAVHFEPVYAGAGQLRGADAVAGAVH